MDNKALVPVMGILIALITSSVGVVAWSYETFATKGEQESAQVRIEKRLERIENKIDWLADRTVRKRD